MPPRGVTKTIAQVRRKTALALRCEGLTFAEIGEQLGVTKQSAHHGVQKELRAVADERRALAEHQVEFELAQIDTVIRGMAGPAEEGDAKAGMVILKAMERRAKLLGLDAPDRIEHSGPTADPTVIHARLGAIAARAARGADADAACDAD